MVMDDVSHHEVNDTDAPHNNNNATFDRPEANKKKRSKAPRKILKAEREKMKREQLNDHFDRLASVLGLMDQNNGKASILNETVRVVKDLVSQIQILLKENATLLSESQYMTAEKNELRDEKAALEAQIKKMRSELESSNQSNTNLNPTHQEIWQPEMTSHLAESQFPQLPTLDPSIQQTPVVGPLYILPIAPDFQTFQKVDATPDHPPVGVSKPHARYPTPADSWPLHLLSKQSEET